MNYSEKYLSMTEEQKQEVRVLIVQRFAVKSRQAYTIIKKQNLSPLEKDELDSIFNKVLNN